MTPLALGTAVLAGCGGALAGSNATDRPAPSERRATEKPRPAGLPPVAHPVPRRVRLPVLTYHRVHRLATEKPPSIPDLTVEPSDFEAQMAGLRRRGFHSVSQRQAYDALFRGARLPSKPVLITVDDGYRDAVTEILPVLRRYGMSATFFVITGRIGEGDYVSTADVRALEAAGMGVGVHSSTHRDLTTLPQPELTRETAASRRKLERILGRRVAFFAYPFGKYDAGVVSAVRRARFSVAFTTESGARLSSTSALIEPRVHVGRRASARTVAALAGAGP